MRNAPFSSYRAHADLIYTSGQIGVAPDGTVPEAFDVQVELAMKGLSDLLRSAASSLDRVIKVTVFLSRASDFEDFNALYRKWFSEPFPARSTIVSDLALPGLLFEIEAVASRSIAGGNKSRMKES
jgi:2-iminobutanoate/2-iminopropanoate deaminase